MNALLLGREKHALCDERGGKRRACVRRGVPHKNTSEAVILSMRVGLKIYTTDPYVLIISAVW